MTYLVILTVQRIINGKPEAKTAQGIVDESLAKTRGELLTYARTLLPDRFQKGEIVFFCCEPNELAVA